VQKKGWKMETNVVSIPPNPDNQIEATVVQENIKLARTLPASFTHDVSESPPELTKVIAHGATM
jgi:translation initiation factor 3 subunit K